jgi:hypothetical protein
MDTNEEPLFVCIRVHSWFFIYHDSRFLGGALAEQIILLTLSANNSV